MNSTTARCFRPASFDGRDPDRFVWASRTWKGPWEFDPKILASLLTWLIYLVLFSTRVSGGWRGRRAAYIAIFGFAAIMVTFLGVSLLADRTVMCLSFGRDRRKGRRQ